MTDLHSIDLKNKFVGLRVDLNVPLESGEVLSPDRLSAALPTILYILEHTDNLCLISHLGRPKEDDFDSNLSLKPIKEWFEKRLNKKISLENEIKKSEGIKMLENIRFFKGENENSENLGQKLADIFDVYIMDAFATAHRKSASTYGAIIKSKIKSPGLLFSNEVSNLKEILNEPNRLVSIIGGSKVSTKLEVVENLLQKSEKIIVGGGIANTFLRAVGYEIGESIYEENMLKKCSQMIKSEKVLLPEKVYVASSPSATEVNLVDVGKVPKEMMILDLEFKSEPVSKYFNFLWNGPLGIFEIDLFSNGTKQLIDFLSQPNRKVIAGGGETIFAINKFSEKKNFHYVSTAGGAFLEYLSGKDLPSVEALELE